MAGLDKRVIAEVLGWEEDHVEKIIRRYVDRMAATKAVILQLNEFLQNEIRPWPAKPSAKPPLEH